LAKLGREIETLKIDSRDNLRDRGRAEDDRNNKEKELVNLLLL
jgi:hypothetical protein